MTNNKVGMYGGSFNPLHIGHVNDIVEASNMCEKLYVILYYSLNKEEIDHHERLMWIKQITKDMPNVEVLDIADESTSKEEYNWEKGRDDTLNKIKEKIDIVFCGSDYKGKNLFERLYPESEVHYFDRHVIDISSTKIRENPMLYYEYLPKEVKSYYTKKVVVVGTESCGKSTLVRNLAKVYNTTYVEEIGRDVCDEAGGIDNMQPKHFEEIIYKHKLREIEKAKEANKVLFIDTDALVTLYYYKLLFEGTNYYRQAFITLTESIAKLDHYDLWLFLEPDVTWVQDGTRTYGEEDIRQKNNKLLKQILIDMKIHFESINGNYQERFIKSKKLINKLLI